MPRRGVLRQQTFDVAALLFVQRFANTHVTPAGTPLQMSRTSG